jgi:hypothetical protein
VHSLRLAYRVESVWSSRMGFIVERCGRKPNCCWGMVLSISRIDLRRLLRFFSRIFPMIGPIVDCHFIKVYFGLRMYKVKSEH